MQKLKDNKSFCLLVFLALFGLSIGTFENYRELWMSSNGITTTSISRVISISYFVTVFVLLYFTIKVSAHKLKLGMCIVLILNMVTGTILINLDNSNNLFLIKFLMFFDIAFKQLVLACVYPLMMNINKNDVLYAKKNFVEFLFSKLGFLLVAILLGKIIFNICFDYNICLLLSVLFNFFAFIVLITIQIETNNKETFNIKKTLNYFNKNKVLYLFLFVMLMSDIVWGSILGMPMLLLTQNLNFASDLASYLILGLGICSNILSMLIVKYFRFQNDQYNLFVKFGIRIILYLLIFLTNNKIMLFITLIYLLLTDRPYAFLFSSYFINNIDEKYSMFLTTLKYCASFLGIAIGTFICGTFFYNKISIFILPTLIVSIIHYILATILLNKRSDLKKLE